jgi:beta-hydroxylase
MPIIYAIAALSLFVLASLTYVYKYRGEARWETLSEYMRKGWPLFAPLNCLLYMFTDARASRSIMNMKEFPEFDFLQKNWQVIRDEAIALHSGKHFEATSKPQTAAYYDLGFRTFYKYGWSKFYLNWYGYTHASAKKLCPKTVEILSQVPQVKGAMFSVLPSGSKLTRHLDPLACSLRYHLGLSTPNDNKCFINVDGKDYSWRDGEGFIFDETYLHYANNNADKTRIILMCDIERPMNILGKIVHFFYSAITRLTVVPNMEGDKRGFVNTVFSAMSPLLAKTKALKQTNRPLYLTIKYTVNTSLILLVMFIVGGTFNVIYNLAGNILR